MADIKVAHLIKWSDGGAYIAVETLSNGLAKLGYQSYVYTEDFDCASEAWKLRKHANQILGSYVGSLQVAGTTGLSLLHHSLSTGSLEALVRDHDVIHLHWLPGLVSNEGVGLLSQLCGQLGRPLLYSIHDMQVLSGACHCFHGCQLWQTDCNRCPQLQSTRWDALPGKILAAKKKYWDLGAITIVSPSEYAAENIVSKSLFASSRVEVIPNSVDLEIFRPQDSVRARSMFKLPQDRVLIAFLPAYESSIKGMSEAAQVYGYLEEREPGKYHWAITRHAYSYFDMGSKNVHGIDFLQSREDCALMYSAADLTLVSSLEEVYPNTVAESLACGTAVVGFHISGLADMISAGYNGYTVPRGDCEAMAAAVQRLANGADLSQNCQQYAKENLAPTKQAERMGNLYQSLLRDQRPQNRVNRAKIPFQFPELAEDYWEFCQEAFRKYYQEEIVVNGLWSQFGRRSMKGKIKLVLLALARKWKHQLHQ